jgi:superfamily I DNA and/or RNA helicase/very-short-patch-repair endonuclease
MDVIAVEKRELALKALENLRMRLLDLTARNSLINFRHSKKASLRIIDEMPDQLVDTLLSDKEMRFAAVPEPTEKQLIDAGYLELDEEKGEITVLKKNPTSEEWARYLGLETSYEVPEPSEDGDADAKHSDNAIQTLLFPYEMESRLKGLLQTSDSAIQEMGANILYLACGFLEWYDSASSDKPRHAPLFLVPVKLSKGRLNTKTGTYEYGLSYTGEDIIPNLSLREKLRIDFAMALPELDEESRPEAYLNLVKQLLENNNHPSWKIRRYISLSVLNFSKLLMYLDLDPARWPEDVSIVDHPVVSRFLSGYGQEESDSGTDDIGFGEEYLIDELADVHNLYPLIDDADSSQHSALIDAVDGKNLVIEGPPGTGKSQTITNLIAAAMAQGKRVLFVAEKLAALEVVKSRLDRAWLGDFCLELHSHKSQKRKVLDEIQVRLAKHRRYREPHHIDTEIVRYEELKSTLTAHVQRINKPWKRTERTLHEIFMTATRYRERLGINPEVVHPEGISGDNFDPITQRRYEDQVRVFSQVYQAVTEQLDDSASMNQHPWYGVGNTDLQIFDQERVNGLLESWQRSLQSLIETREQIAEALQQDLAEIPETLSSLEMLLADLKSLPPLAGDELLDTLPRLQGDVLAKVYRYLQLFEDIQKQYAMLKDKVGAAVLQDLDLVEGYLAGSQQLQSLVGKDVGLGQLAEAINRLTAIQGQLSELTQPLEQIQRAVGGDAAAHLTVTPSGLRELSSVLGMATALDASLWHHRSELFDNDALDALLPLLRAELEPASSLRERLGKVFNLESFPGDEELLQLKATLDDGGLLRWFKGSWRSARKQVLGFAKDRKAPLATMNELLPDASDYVSRIKKLTGNHNYQRALGQHFAGLDTDLSSIEALRDWYRQVRKEYGIGFGTRVALGNALLHLPGDLARGLRSLSEQGMRERLADILDDLESLKKIFFPVTAMQKDDVLLIGDGNVVSQLLAELELALKACGPIADDQTISITELGDRIESLNALKHGEQKWREADYDNRLFQGRLGLRAELEHDNSAGLSALRNTLAMADSLKNGISTKVVIQAIHANPTTTTFDKLGRFRDSLESNLVAYANARDEFTKVVRLDFWQWSNECGDALGALYQRNTKAQENFPSLLNWLEYVRSAEQLTSSGLSGIAHAIEEGTVAIDRATDALNAGIHDLLAREILREEPELGRFSGRTQEALQKQFVEYDNKLKKLQCEKIAWRIDQNEIPQGGKGVRASERSELTLIEAECSKKKRHIPIRQLIHNASQALSALKPCFMMGPMSVAQYLAPGQIKFDLIVMDEASQIKPQDALGAIARGAQLVVVGDPKQLPPTSFFDRAIDGDDEDPTAIEESESILDATLPMFTARRLRWHYRSQHENLIAFSNHSFYDSDLVLFPSPHNGSDGYGLHYKRLRHGCFVNRRNIEEARVISEATRDHFLRRPGETLGIVAMSASQQTQIEQAIETLAKEDEAFREALEVDSYRTEKLFVKNLENVQGDERDVIYISMTYGPQEPGGKVFQRFGPINSDVGWRRLNVLFTRSKKRMHIFSSMDSSDILVSSTSKRGVKALRGFLEYCETGLLNTTDHETGREPDSDFEVAVMEAMGRHGFECVPQVGVAGFFIDIAVVDPGNPGKYLMGIECDGATYHSAKSARDRDRLRQAILERLGWKIRRIWSTDWFKNPHAELQPIIRELNSLKSEPVIEIESESVDVDEIVQHSEEQEVIIEPFVTEHVSLKDKLLHFDANVIRPRSSGTSEHARLLRPAMLEALLEYQPTSKVEFLEYIPSYLRQATAPEQGAYLDQVFEIINGSAQALNNDDTDLAITP